MQVVQQQSEQTNQWSNFVLSTLNDRHVYAARFGSTWTHVGGNTYRSQTGATHTCDASCLSWVFRSDGLKFCAISGLCVDRLKAEHLKTVSASASKVDARRKKLMQRRMRRQSENVQANGVPMSFDQKRVKRFEPVSQGCHSPSFQEPTYGAETSMMEC